MIEVEHLTKFYGPVPAIADLSFRIGQGEIVGFLGPNGAGKTTTMKVLTGFLPPTSGSARVDGLDISRQALQVKGKIGYLPENNPLSTEMTVESFLYFAAQAKGLPRAAAETAVSKAVADCTLEAVKGRIIGHLSKGFRQRVGLAQALLNNPPVLILDEPTIGLDPAQVVEIRQLIQSLGQERTILLSSHILPEVSQVCQKVIILNQGRIVATDTVAGLTAQLQNSRKVQLLVRGPGEEILKTLAAQSGVIRAEAGTAEGEYRVELEKDREVRADLSRAIVRQGWDLLELRSQELSLEEIFVQLVTEEAPESEMEGKACERFPGFGYRGSPGAEAGEGKESL
ncbi:MAG: ATP-binding cassette domain-containing protein [Deltaproteobacteria bacterium]|nr:ATP-binding cassette domain-containing protein [Deltaproteobacteria bacterium]